MKRNFDNSLENSLIKEKKNKSVRISPDKKVSDYESNSNTNNAKNSEIVDIRLNKDKLNQDSDK